MNSCLRRDGGRRAAFPLRRDCSQLKSWSHYRLPAEICLILSFTSGSSIDIITTRSELSKACVSNTLSRPVTLAVAAFSRTFPSSRKRRSSQPGRSCDCTGRCNRGRESPPGGGRAPGNNNRRPFCPCSPAGSSIPPPPSLRLQSLDSATFNISYCPKVYIPAKSSGLNSFITSFALPIKNAALTFFSQHWAKVQALYFSTIKMSKKAISSSLNLAKRVRLGRPGTSLRMGLLGMANIGKSSTFNVLTRLDVPVENRPFCTIDPNHALIQVQDPRFEELVSLFSPAKVTPPVLRIVDIAGLVKGASEGFGLGNEFLSHVMQVDGLYHVVRAFGGEEVAHTQGNMNPVRDVQIIRNQLILKDSEILEKKVKQIGRKASRSQDRLLKEEHEVIKKALHCLQEQKLEVRYATWTNTEAEYLNRYNLLTAKPMVYLINLNKEDFLAGRFPRQKQIEEVVTLGGKSPAKIIPFSVEVEQSTEAQGSSKAEQIIRAAYQELELSHFYTVGKDEVRAWAIRTGQTALEAGGKIHTDFIRGFISAEVINSSDLIRNPSFVPKLGKHLKKEGKKYVVRDGDILQFNCKIK